VTEPSTADHASTPLNGPQLWLERFPWPTPATHKHSRGRMGVVSGELWMTGAARMAARAGLRVGAGVVRLFCREETFAVNAAHAEAVILKRYDGEQDLEAAGHELDSMVIGPGAGLEDQTRLNVLALARTGAALLIDADAITVFKNRPDDLFTMLDRDDVLTPHEGEFERLFPSALGQGNRVGAAREAAARAGSIVMLKGSETVVAAPDGRVAVNRSGSPWLATAGSGDVLAGFVGGLVAQGMDSFDAACAGAWIHAQAAEAFGPGLIAEDLPDLAPPVLRRLYEMRR
jgi:ADP-dependent NAD(P)H-hydrate dehydratase / NAD(P)H-hydrate epimerase